MKTLNKISIAIVLYLAVTILFTLCTGNRKSGHKHQSWQPNAGGMGKGGQQYKPQKHN